MGGIKPNLAELPVRRANVVVDRFARPLETVFRHGAVFRGRFHENAPDSPNLQFSAVVCVAGMTA
jgi:hypothetical protein